MSPLLKTDRKAVSAASGQARRPSLAGHVAGAPGLGRQARPQETSVTAEPEDDLEDEGSSSGWKERLPWRRSKRTKSEPAVGGADWSGSADLTTKALKIAFVGALVAGPVALVLNLGQDAPVIVQKGDGQGAKVAPAVVSDSTTAGERGLQTVRTWLASSDGSEQIQLETEGSWPKTGQKVETARVASATRAEDSTEQWEVTVAARLPKHGEMYFAVPVRVTDGKATAVALPRVVPAPAPVSAPQLAYEKTGIALGAPLSQTVEEFLGAYLAGQETTRFTSPGASVPAVSGNPWTQLELSRVDVTTSSGADPTSEKPKEGEEAQVLVEYAMQRGNDKTTQIPSSMALSLKARGGRWEITSIDSAPQLDAPKTAPSSDGESTTPTE